MKLKQDSILSTIGLAMKAGKVVSGEVPTETAVKSKKAFLVIISEDASKNTTKKFTNMCTFYNVPILSYSSKEALGRALGKDMRSSLALVDEGFAKVIKRKLEENGGNLNG